MNEPISSQANSLSYLIPTGEHDIAVREVLAPIFGDAILCKVPGAPCGAQSAADASGSSGALVETVFNIFNGGTVVFATILLIFIGIMIFVRTAQDGEFMGKSWNTTFTALRLVAGIAFILPMPNGYSTIQNFVMYVGLWSSGLANQTNVAVSEHYLKRLQLSMINQDKSATNIRPEAQAILAMHLCASISEKLYGSDGMQLRVQRRTSSTPIDQTTTAAVDALGNSTGGNPFVVSNYQANDRIEIAYTQVGTYPNKGSAPCGRIVINPIGDLSTTVSLGSAVPSDAYNAALGGKPLTANARDKIARSLQEVAENARKAKLDALSRLMSESGKLRYIADQLVTRYVAGDPQYDKDTGRLTSAPVGTNTDRLSSAEAIAVLNAYSTELRTVEAELNASLDSYRTQTLNKTQTNGEGTFFGDAKAALEGGGWMGAASTYRMMLDMTSIKFTGEKQSPVTIEARNDVKEAVYSPDLARRITALQGMMERTLGSDTAKDINQQVMGGAINPYAMTPATVTMTSMEKLASGKLSTNDAIDVIYGTQILDGFRNWIVKSLSLSSDYDPLYQIKSIGDSATEASELLIVGEFGFRAFTAITKATATTARAQIVGGTVDLGTGGVTGIMSFTEAAQYVAEQLFVMMRALTVALASIGYMFSTWLPAIPYMAFLLASLGWIFGLTMTLFAVNIWGVMHLTPARNDSFIGSEAQGYLLLAALFFRPVIAVSALSLSYVMAPPLMKLINMTLLPMMMANNSSTNTLSIIFATLFNLVLYFSVVKAVLMMVYMIPQSFPDEVMRIISAGIGDLGQSKGMSTMESSEGTGRMATESMGGASLASSEAFKGTVRKQQDAAAKAAEEAKAKLGATAPSDRGDPNQFVQPPELR